MGLSAGTRLGPYEIVTPIGAGGMGEVYRARDTRLGRDVAVKVLPAEFAADPGRLRRFEQEARAVAALNHPNILALYDVGSHDGGPFVVTELLKGESLREQIVQGGLTVSRSVELGIQIARGLAAAHEQGVVHRDLKPGNVFVTHDGRVKILDFGLAKLAQPALPSDPLAETATAAPGTEPGVVMGTVGYMSPEQVRGIAVDHRTDVFAFGCLLYEMLSGQRAFRGETAADTLSAILSKDPPPLSSSICLRRSTGSCAGAWRSGPRIASARRTIWAWPWRRSRRNPGPRATRGKRPVGSW
jgi:serine/threonine protein kinase